MVRLVLILSFAFCAAACNLPEKEGKGPYSITVSWTANKEKDVNAAGGGYKVYYSATKDFNIPSGLYVDVPYVSGATAPTTATISNLSLRAPNSYYIKIVAYSALTNHLGRQAVSSASQQYVVTVP
jgi:hypothetical protein